ncbi:hypothetical protein T439DRAFT_320714 [Meredithblackwellia eburnea MCA 4105]
MDLSRPRNPPSPPASTASSKSSPVLPLSPTPLHTPPESPDMLPPTPPASILAPLAPLNRELFLLTLDFLQPSAREKTSLLLVSKAWHGAMLSEPSLWTDVVVRIDVEPSFELALRWIQRSSVNSSNSNSLGRGGVQALAIRLDDPGQNATDFLGLLETRYHTILEHLDEACVLKHPRGQQPRTPSQSTLRILNCDFRPYAHATLVMLNIIGQSASAPVFNDLYSVEIWAGIPDLPISHSFFTLWPSAPHVRFICAPVSQNTPKVPKQELGWLPPTDTEEVPATPINLGHLLVQNAYITPDLSLPLVPCLTYLQLHNVVWEGKAFFFLLRLCRKTLKALECVKFALVEAENPKYTDDWLEYVDITDPELTDNYKVVEWEDEEEPLEEVAPINFPLLRALTLSGNVTQPFFASLDILENMPEGIQVSTPNFIMPQLERARFDHIDLDLEEEEYGELDEEPLGTSPLAMFGQRAPNVVDLDLSRCLVNDGSLFACFESMHSCLRRLALRDTQVTDRLLIRLHSLTPHLEALDVRSCDLVSVQGVARLVELSRDSPHSSRRLNRVQVDAPAFGFGYREGEELAHNWLEFIEVLVRDEWDFESLGPANEVDRRRWVKYGKLDLAKEMERQRLEEERRLLEARYRQAQAQAARQAQAQAQYQTRPQHPYPRTVYIPTHQQQPHASR